MKISDTARGALVMAAAATLTAVGVAIGGAGVAHAADGTAIRNVQTQQCITDMGSGNAVQMSNCVLIFGHPAAANQRWARVPIPGAASYRFHLVSGNGNCLYEQWQGADAVASPSCNNEGEGGEAYFANAPSMLAWNEITNGGEYQLQLGQQGSAVVGHELNAWPNNSVTLWEFPQ